MGDRAERHAKAGMNDFEHYFTSCSELSEENHTLRQLLAETEVILGKINDGIRLTDLMNAGLGINEIEGILVRIRERRGNDLTIAPHKG